MPTDIDEYINGGFRKFASFSNTRRQDMHERKGFNQRNIRGQVPFKRNLSQDVGSRGQDFSCNTPMGYKNADCKKGWFPSKTNRFGNRWTHRGGYFGSKVYENEYKEQKSPWYQGEGSSLNHVRGHGRGGFRSTYNRGHAYYHQDSYNYKDAENSACNKGRLNSHSSTGGRWIKRKVFPDNHGQQRGRGHCLPGRFKGVGPRCGINEGFQSENSQVRPSILSSVNVDSTEELACKADENVDSLPSLRVTKDYHSICMKERTERDCCMQGPSLKSNAQLPIVLRSEPQVDKIPTSKDGYLERAFISCAGGTMKRRRLSAVRDFPVQGGKLRFVSGNKVMTKSKDKKSKFSECLVMKESVQAGSDFECTAANEISKIGKMIMAPPDCSHAGLEVIMEDCNKPHLEKKDDSSYYHRCNLETINEDDSKPIVAEGTTFLKVSQVSPENFVKNCNKLTLSMGNARKPSEVEANAFAELLQATPKEVIEHHSSSTLPKRNARKPILAETTFSRELPQASSVEIDENCNSTTLSKKNASKAVVAKQNSSAEFPQISPESVIEKCNTMSLLKENFGEGQASKMSRGNNKEACSKNFFLEKDIGSADCCEVIQSDLSEVSVHDSDWKRIQNFENSMEISSLLSTNKSFHVATSDSLLTALQENEQILPKDIHENRIFDEQAVAGVHEFKSEVTKVSATVTEVLHDDLAEIKKPKVYRPLGLERETNGNVRNKNARARLVHKGSNRAKVFQTSKSFDPNDAPKLSNLEAAEGLSDRALVKRTLQEFECIRKALGKSQNAVKRADLDAASVLRKNGKWRNCGEKIIGEVPGVEVGDQFSFRMEMLIIGLHRQVQSGIDYIPGTKRRNGSSLATSIVSSGGYEDDKDDGNTLIYSGQGGNNMKGNKRQESNQELVRGNLALSNSMKEKTPVRVIRGTADSASPSSRVYIYDGLYDVVNYSLECGAAGFSVYQFTLTRRAGQLQVGLSFLNSLKKKGLTRPNLLLHDISRGQERLPICVVNEVDEEPAPLQFSYIPSIKYPTWYLPLPSKGCECVGVCDEETCSCSIKNGGEFPYNEKGYILRDKVVVYECGPSCSCSSSCENRVRQKGLRYRLEVFKTKNRGWGVRSLDSIQPGGFICEYTGELLSDAEAEQRIGNDEYLFDLGNKCKPCMVQSDLTDVNTTATIVAGTDDVAYTIDAKGLGNVARFINHSCSPNLYAQNVLYDSDDSRFPHVMLFAMENIPPMRELTYDYNYSIDEVQDVHGNVKIKACYCGAQDCQGRLY